MSETASLFVCLRHSVEGGDPKRRHMPGELITLNAGEAAELQRLGFLQDGPVVFPEAGGIANPSGIGHKGGERAQGPRW
jgi:hypothetical protein